MNPIIMETPQIAKATLPAVPAMPPIENRTRAGTPLATQNAPRQSIDRTNCPDGRPEDAFDKVSVVILFPLTLTCIEIARGDRYRSRLGQIFPADIWHFGRTQEQSVSAADKGVVLVVMLP